MITAELNATGPMYNSMPPIGDALPECYKDGATGHLMRTPMGEIIERRRAHGRL